MKMDSASSVQAKNFAYRLLNYRERSVKELEDRLIRKGFTKEISTKVVADLKALGLVDDYKFARAFIEGRLKYRPCGLALIRSRLYSKGIPEHTVNSVISGIERDYDEYKVAYEIASSKLGRFNKKVSRIKAKRRIYDYLLRRRFKKEIIYKVLNNIFKSSE